MLRKLVMAHPDEIKELRKAIVAEFKKGKNLSDIILEMNHAGYSELEIRETLLGLQRLPEVKKKLEHADAKAMRETIMALLFAGVGTQKIFKFLSSLAHKPSSISKAMAELGLHPNKDSSIFLEEHSLRHEPHRGHAISYRQPHPEHLVIPVGLTLFILIGLALAVSASSLDLVSSLVVILIYIPPIWFLSRNVADFVSPPGGERFQIPPHLRPMIVILLIAILFPIAMLFMHYYPSEKLFIIYIFSSLYIGLLSYLIYRGRGI